MTKTETTPSYKVPAEAQPDQDSKAISPIERLPAELLSRIFILRAAVCVIGLSHTVQFTPTQFQKVMAHLYCSSYCWIRLTLVCHEWRNLALNTQQLWATLSPRMSPEFIRLAMVRSGTAPLTILSHPYRRVGTDFEVRGESLKLILSHLPRIRSVHVGDVKDLNILSSPALHLDAPLLENLIVDHGFKQPLSDSPIPYLSSLKLPSLSQLSLKEASLSSLTSIARPGLTLLAATTHGIPDSGLPALLDVLRGLPNLTRLELNLRGQTSPGQTRSLPTARRSTELTKLQALSLSDKRCSRATEWLLDHLVYPSPTKLAVEVSLREPDEDAVVKSVVRKMFSLNGSTQQDMSGPCSIAIKAGPSQLFTGGEPIVVFSSWDTLQSLDTLALSQVYANFDSPTPTPTATLRIQSPSALNTISQQFFVERNIGTVIRLYVDFHGGYMTSSQWVQLFRALPRLEEMIIQRSETVRLFIETTNPRNNQQESEQFLYPKLRVLRLDKVVFSVPDHPEFDVFPKLYSALHSLRAQGLQLGKLEILQPRNLLRKDFSKLIEPEIAERVAVLESQGDTIEIDEWEVLPEDFKLLDSEVSFNHNLRMRRDPHDLSGN